MVEVNPGKSQINVKAGWFFFFIACLIAFPILFYLGPTGNLFYALWAAVVLALLIEIFVFGAPMGLIIVTMLGIIITVLVKRFM